MRRGLVLLALFLLFAPAPAMAQMCPIEKNPTNIDLYVDRNNESGALDATATLTVISLVGKASAPLALKTVYFQECAIGNISAAAGTCPPYSHICDVKIVATSGLDPYVPPGKDVWNCSPTGCCMQLQAKQTDSQGQAAALFPIMENATIFAAYLGGDVYLSSNSTANYLYPPALGALSITACWPLFLILGLLIVSMNAMGQSPLGAFDFSAIRAPKAKAVAVTPMMFAPGMAIKKAVEGTKAAQQERKNRKMVGEGLIEKEKDANGRETERYVITERGKSSPIGVEADGRGGFTTARERTDKENQERDRGWITKVARAVGGKTVGVAYSATTGGWAGRGDEKKSKAAGKLEAMRINGEATRDPKTGKYTATKMDENTKKLVEDPTNQGKVDALMRTATKDLGLGAFLRFGARSIGRAADAQMWAISAGKAGQAPGMSGLNRVPLVKLVGWGNKGGGTKTEEETKAGVKPISISNLAPRTTSVVEKKFDKVTYKPHAEGERRELKPFPKLVAGTTAGVGRVHDFLLAMTGHDLGKKAFELKLGPIQLIYGMSHERLDSGERNKAYEEYKRIQSQSTTRISWKDFKNEYEERNKNVEKFVAAGLVQQKGHVQVRGANGETQEMKLYELTAKGKKALKEDANPELKKWARGNRGEGKSELQATSYNTLQGIVSLNGKKSSVDERGNRYGSSFGGVGVPARGVYELNAQGDVYFKPPAQSTARAAMFTTVVDAIGIAGVAGLVRDATGIAVVRGGPQGMVQGFAANNAYPMRFVQQKYFDLQGTGVGATQATGSGDSGDAELVQNVLTKDPANWDPGDIEAVQRYAYQHPELAAQIAEKKDGLEHFKGLEGKGVALEGWHVDALKGALKKQDGKSFEVELFRKDLTESLTLGFTQRGGAQPLGIADAASKASVMTDYVLGAIGKSEQKQMLGKLKALSTKFGAEVKATKAIAPFEQLERAYGAREIEGDIKKERVKLENIRNRAVEISSIGKYGETGSPIDRQNESEYLQKQMGEQEKRLQDLEKKYEEVSKSVTGGLKPVSANAQGARRYQKVDKEASSAQAIAAERERLDPMRQVIDENLEQNMMLSRLEDNMAAMREKLKQGKYADLYG